MRVSSFYIKRGGYGIYIFHLVRKLFAIDGGNFSMTRPHLCLAADGIRLRPFSICPLSLGQHMECLIPYCCFFFHQKLSVCAMKWDLFVGKVHFWTVLSESVKRFTAILVNFLCYRKTYIIKWILRIIQTQSCNHKATYVKRWNKEIKILLSYSDVFSHMIFFE